MTGRPIEAAFIASLTVTATAPAAGTRVPVDLEQEEDLMLFEFKHQNKYFKEKPAFRPSPTDRHATTAPRRSGSRRTSASCPGDYPKTGPVTTRWNATSSSRAKTPSAEPNGRYHVWAVHDDCGCWGGETSRHHRRPIRAEGQELWVSDRGPNGPADYLFRFESVEPKPGADGWDLYMKDLFGPARLSTQVTDGEGGLGVPRRGRQAGPVEQADAARGFYERRGVPGEVHRAAEETVALFVELQP